MASWGAWLTGSSTTQPVAPQECVFPELSSPTTLEEYKALAEKKFQEVKAMALSNDGFNPYPFTPPAGHEDIKLWDIHKDDSPIDSVKGIAVINYPIDDLFKLMQSPDVAVIQKWDADINLSFFILHLFKMTHSDILKCVEHAVLQDNLRVFMTVYWAPYPVTHRQFVIVRYTKREEDGTAYIVFFSVNHKDFPVDANYVRGIAMAGYVMRPVASNPKMTEITRVVRVDPKGSIPIWVINMFKGKLGTGLVGLRGYVKELSEKAAAAPTTSPAPTSATAAAPAPATATAPQT